MTFNYECFIIVPMTKKDKFFKFTRNPIFIVLCAILAGGMFFLCKYLRYVALVPYKTVNLLGLFTLLLAIVNVFLVSKDTKSSVKELFIENLPGLFFFVAFIAIKLILRGSK